MNRSIRDDDSPREIIELILALFRPWRLYLLYMILTGTVGYFASYLYENRYDASVLVLVRPEEQISITRSEEKELLSYSVMPTQTSAAEPTDTFIAMITSRTIAVRVVEFLGLDKPEVDELGDEPEDWLGKAQYWFVSFAMEYREKVAEYVWTTMSYLLYGRYYEPDDDFEAAVEGYMENIDVAVLAESFLIKITYAGETPEEAAAVANAAADIFLQQLSEMNVSDQVSSLQFLGAQIETMKRKFDNALLERENFKKENDTIDLDEEIAAEIRVIADLESSLELANSALSGLRAAPGFSSADLAMREAEKEYLEPALAARRKKLGERSSIQSELVRLDAVVTSTQQIYGLLRMEYEESLILQNKQYSGLRIVGPAVAPSAPRFPRNAVAAAVAALAALMIAAYVVGFRELMTPRIRSVSDVERALSLRVLSTIPKARLLSMATSSAAAKTRPDESHTERPLGIAHRRDNRHRHTDSEDREPGAPTG